MKPLTYPTHIVRLMLGQERHRVERETIERCANVCDEMRRQMQDRSADNHYTACAQSIRALTPAQKASDGNNGERK